ncbi:hypothetical protein OKW35_000305 [Paraburkholderia sp. MM5477-R1]
MGEGQAALSHHLDKITQTELVAQIPTHAKDDDFAVEMTPVEQPFEIFQLAHLARGRQKLKSNRPTHRNCTTTVAQAQSQVKLMLFGGRDHDVYLGCLNCSDVASGSVHNDIGQYGSDISPKSIFNDIGQYGSDILTSS